MTERLYLPQVTVVAITDSDHGKTIEAMLHTLKQIRPARAILFSDVYLENDEFENILINPLRSAKAYNEFVVWKLGHYIDSSHLLIIQHDGYVIDPTAWTDEFLQYDYIGATWRYTDGRNVGNGGFSLRSKRLHDILATDPAITVGSPEDEIICRLYRGYLETHHGIKYAPDALANQFSYEMNQPFQKTFGFHNFFWKPYQEPIILKRSYAMGDVIMLEPVMEYFYNKGYRVILDCDIRFYNLFAHHFFPIEHITELREEYKGYRVINFDMAYEVQPKSLVLEAYFKCTGVKDYKLRNPMLNFGRKKEYKLFPKYAVIHINETDMPYRNIQNIDWMRIVKSYLHGYTVLQIGKGGPDIAPRINTEAENFLGFVIGGADLFIGSDSGPSQIAVACGVKSMIFFGSVNPKYRYADLRNITIIQEPCGYAGCYHEVVSENGQTCRFDKEHPPCVQYSTEEVIKNLKALI